VLTGFLLVIWNREIGHDLRMFDCNVPRRLIDQYRFPAFRPLARLIPHPFDPQARVIVLIRRQKKLAAATVAKPAARTTTAIPRWFVTCLVAGCASTCSWTFAGSTAGVAA